MRMLLPDRTCKQIASSSGPSALYSLVPHAITPPDKKQRNNQKRQRVGRDVFPHLFDFPEQHGRIGATKSKRIGQRHIDLTLYLGIRR